MKIKKSATTDHKIITRRDFLSHGLIGGISYTLVPSLLGMLQIKNVYGAENCFVTADLSKRKTPIIILDLSGGGNIAGSNVIVGLQGGQHSYLPSYGRLGMPDMYHPQNSGMINNELGLKFHSKSGMLKGLLQTTNTTIRQKCEGMVFCSVSSDDTGNNPHNPVYWLNKAGSIGDLVQTAGTTNSRSGGRSNVPAESYDPTIAPVPLTSPQGAVELVSLGRVSNLFNQQQAKSILRTIENMSERSLASFSQKTLPEQIREVVSCGFSKANIDGIVHNSGTRFNQNTIDPLQDNNVNLVYTDINSTDGTIRNRQRKEATMAKLVLDGYIGTGTIEMGGYDYHNTARDITDGRDQLVGECIGRIFNLASKKGTDVAVYVYTDGAVSTNKEATDPNAEGKYIFTSDSGDRSASFMMVYKHSGRPELRHTSSNFNEHQRQIGWFKTNESVDAQAGLVSNNVTNLAKAVVANYLALHGEENRLEEIVGNNPFSSEYEKYLIMKKM